MNNLEHVWREWGEATGDVHYPISQELCVYLDRFVQEHGITRAADIGAGLSSWLLRSLMQDVTSFELSRDHARQTERHFGIAGIEQWPPTKPSGRQWPLVVYDSAPAPGAEAKRADALPLAASMVSPGGFMVIDDMHWLGYQLQAYAFFMVAEWPFRILEETRDQWGRYAAIAGPKRMGT